MKLKHLALTGLALVIAQSSFAAQPGKYAPVGESMHAQCSDSIKAKLKAANRSATNSQNYLIYQNGNVSWTFDGHQVSVPVTNNHGSVPYAFTDKNGGKDSGTWSVQLETGDFINLSIHSFTQDPNTKYNMTCDITGRFARQG